MNYEQIVRQILDELIPMAYEGMEKEFKAYRLGSQGRRMTEARLVKLFFKLKSEAQIRITEEFWYDDDDRKNAEDEILTKLRRACGLYKDGSKLSMDTGAYDAIRKEELLKLVILLRSIGISLSEQDGEIDFDVQYFDEGPEEDSFTIKELTTEEIEQLVNQIIEDAEAAKADSEEDAKREDPKADHSGGIESRRDTRERARRKEEIRREHEARVHAARRSLLESIESEAVPADKLSEEEFGKQVDSYLDYFKDFNMPDWCRDELRGFISYMIRRPKFSIPYNFLVETATDSLTRSFAEAMQKVLNEIRHYFPPIQETAETDILNRSYFSGDGILLINKCLQHDEYYITDNDSSTTSDRKAGYDKRWENLMNWFDKCEDALVILSTPPEIVKDRFKYNSRLYYRFFRCHIILADKSAEEIISESLDKLYKSASSHSDDFEPKLAEYIETVYPKADLKNKDFVDDLFVRIMSNAFRVHGNYDYLDERCIPFYHKSQSFDSIDKEFRSLVGLESVKETFRDIGILCNNIKENGETPYLHMVFRGNPGTGKTTVAKYVAKLLSSMRVIKRNHVEEVMTSDLLGRYIGHTGPRVEGVLKRASGGVLVIDEAYLLSSFDGSGSSFRDEAIGTLLKGMEKKSDPVIIFAGYSDLMDEFLKSNPGLTSRIGYNITFEDYDDDQLVEIFKSMCDKSGYGYDDRALEAVRNKIIALRFEDNFGNARTVENIFSQAATECLREGAGRTIRAEHIRIGKIVKTLQELQSELDRMVGLENAKRVIREQMLSNRFSKELGKEMPSSNNMVFVGNPGTGKTTTAKIFAEMLFSIGIAKSPRTKFISAKDLYVSDVAGKLNEICNEAMGGVLFIDEIYLLNRFPAVCTEVISVLLELLESKKEDLTIILAGYEAQMDEFLNENQGLKSRFPITVHFDDFSEDELCELFLLNASEGGMTVSDEAMDAFRKLIRSEMKKPNFGNGRTVRNIYEQSFRRHAVNYYENESPDPDVFNADDIAEAEEVTGSKTHIGFTL